MEKMPYHMLCMMMIRFREVKVTEEQVYEKGHHYIKMPLGDICVFIRDGRIFPLAEGGEYVAAVHTDNLKLYSCGENAVPYALYDDDGNTKEYDLANCRILTV